MSNQLKCIDEVVMKNTKTRLYKSQWEEFEKYAKSMSIPVDEMISRVVLDHISNSRFFKDFLKNNKTT